LIANSLVVTLAILLALGFWLLGELRFLAPYRPILIHHYGYVLLFWSAILFTNVFAAIHAIQRKFFLKDTGRKLSHLDAQLAAGQTPLSSPTAEREHV